MTQEHQKSSVDIAAQKSEVATTNLELTESPRGTSANDIDPQLTLRYGTNAEAGNGAIA